MSIPVNVFFLGKGGVGKSTSSSLYSIDLADQGSKTLLVSMDPAHNLCDIFNRSFSDKPTRLNANLSIMELNQEKWISRYLRDIAKQIKQTYTYLTAFNLEHYFDVIRFSPGLEEYALILAFQQIRQSYADFDYLIFDMPPTALAVRFLCLPSLSLTWADKLRVLRQQIIEKRELITTIKLLGKERETDKVMNRIENQQASFNSLKELFESGQETKIKLVMNPDTLSSAESERIRDQLQEKGIRIDQIFMNKIQGNPSGTDPGTAYPGTSTVMIPWSQTPLNGIDELTAFLKKHPGLFIH